jgi:monoamine oxidase
MNRREFLRQSAGATAWAVGQSKLEKKGPARKVIIVGAGLSGLSAGYELTRAGHDVTILEAQARLGGPRARQLASLKESERISFVLEHTEKLFPGIRENFEVGVSKCWDEDEWERGASSWYKPGQMSELWPHVARPEGRVHFAGEHTSAWIRWMQGALHSGNRVAREVNDAI